MIPYGFYRYKEHYFYNNFKDLKKRSGETMEEANTNRREARDRTDEKNENREYVPYKIAVRMYDAIQFSTRLDGRDDSLKLSKKTI